MTAEQLRAARSGLGLTAQDFARTLGLARNTLAKYESGEQPVPKYIDLAVETLRSRAET